METVKKVMDKDDPYLKLPFDDSTIEKVKQEQIASMVYSVLVSSKGLGRYSMRTLSNLECQHR